jgi:hypothetical protein
MGYVPVQYPPGQRTKVIKAGEQAALVQKRLQQLVIYTIEREEGALRSLYSMVKSMCTRAGLSRSCPGYTQCMG